MNEMVKAGLTPQQVRVAEGLLLGLRNKEIADRIGLSERTVKAHLCRMFSNFRIDTPSFRPDACAKRILLARKLLCA